ncbi:plancitoxin-1-like isoform X2 [Andrena cerasifolii]|uniref:plancitoxin-1-like isoform X2 n=1 Tax=Andrena cerasifolii TaxID=2819439 RepID=UPI004037F145
MRHVLVRAVALLIAHSAVNAIPDTPQCRDENNMPVDWYGVYKLPKLTDNPNPRIRTGEAYLFMTDQTVDQGWQLSNRTIGAADSILAKTLAPLYSNENNAEILWALYNDDPPVNRSQWAPGHAKGVVMVNNNRGFWLIHSVPKFPSFSASGYDIPFSYPENGLKNGQSFLCVSLGSNQLDTVGKQLSYNEIRTYAKNIPGTIGPLYLALVAATENRRIYNPPFTSKVVIKSLNLAEFTSFAKAKNWNNDLYDNYVAPELQTSLYVQSWLNTGDPLRSKCNGFNVYDVQNGTYARADVYYPSTKDHAKVATSDNNNPNKPGSINWICVGDINRTYSQRDRGGGTLCFQHRKAWENYGQLIYAVDLRCP